MDSKLIYKDDVLELVDDFMDVGYMAEDIMVEDIYGTSKQIKRSTQERFMTLLISFPFIDDTALKELLMIDELLSHIQVGINCYFIFEDETKIDINLQQRLKKFEIVFDKDEEYADMYGTKIVSDILKDCLTKALFLISKDGAIFYIDMPSNIEEAFDLEFLRLELNRAYQTYNGKGCHE